MASLRKKYQNVEVPAADNNAPAVASAPVEAAVPPPAAETKAPEKPTESNPVDEAAKSALKARLDEMTRAEGLQREFQQGQHRLATEPPQQPQQPPTAEQIIANANIPDRAKHWLRQHPEYITDPAKNNTLIALHDVAKRMSGEEFSDYYFKQLDHLLGFGQQPQPQRPQPQPNGAPSHANGYAPARNGATQPRQQQRPSGIPVSAPPTRDAPSMSTGRASYHRAPLTEAQAEIARNSGLSLDEYREQLEKMNRLKATGAIQ